MDQHVGSENVATLSMQLHETKESHCIICIIISASGIKMLLFMNLHYSKNIVPSFFYAFFCYIAYFSQNPIVMMVNTKLLMLIRLFLLVQILW